MFKQRIIGLLFHFIDINTRTGGVFVSFLFENQGTNTYLVYKISADDNLDTMSLGMLTNNKIPGLAPTLFTQMDATKYIKYNVSGKISVSQFFSGPVNRKRLVGVFSGIVDAMLSAEDYMIDTNSIILDLDYIFADVSSCESILICLPILTEKEPIDIERFFKNIMFSTQFDQTENCDYVAKIINYLNSSPVFSLTDFKALLDGIKSNASSNTARNISPSPQTQSSTNSTPPATVQVKQNVQNVTQTNQKAVSAPIKTKVTSAVQKTPAVQKSVNNTAQQYAVPTQPKQEVQVSSEKKISMFGLLMHYSKENAELYKAQKAAKKAVKQQPTQKNQQTSKKTAPTSFAVPGAPTQNVDFAISGQSTPVSATVQQSQNAVITQNQRQVESSSYQNSSIPVSQKPSYQSFDSPQSKAMNFGDTTVLGGGSIGETTVLNAVPQAAQIVTPHLIRAKNNEKIMLNKPVFRIGKERSYVDYFVADNTAVSRSHANMISRDGEFFIVDTNSKNHTYVNGTMIQSNAETKIVHGDKIRLANEDFEFKLY